MNNKKYYCIVAINLKLSFALIYLTSYVFILYIDHLIVYNVDVPISLVKERLDQEFKTKLLK